MPFEVAAGKENFNEKACQMQLELAVTMQDMYNALGRYAYVETSGGVRQPTTELISDLETIAREILNGSEEDYEKNARAYRAHITDQGKIYTNFLRIMRKETGKILLPM